MSAAPRCPRCDYDLSGQVAAWPSDRCPLEGQCSECGLAVLWRDLLNPRFFILHGHFEHAARRRIRALFRTTLAAFRPWRLWSWLKMSHDIVWTRIVVVVVVAAVVGHVAIAAVIEVTESVALSMWYSPPTTVPQLVTLLWPYADDYWWSPGAESAPPLITLPCLITFALTPVTFLLLPQTLRRARVRRAHLVRVWLYLLASVPIIIALPAAIDAFTQLLIFQVGVNWPYPRDGLSSLASLLLSAAWVLLWWWCAGKRYLRLHSALAIAAAMTTISLLTAILLTLLLGALSSRLSAALSELLA